MQDQEEKISFKIKIESWSCEYHSIRTYLIIDLIGGRFLWRNQSNGDI